MHYPEMWGYLQFSDIIAGEGKASFVPDPDSGLKWELRTLYYAQRAYATANGHFSNDPEILKSLGFESSMTLPEIILTHSGYEASALSDATGKLWIINDKGRIFYK
ncbi:MAG: hypothetical protein E4G95_09055 [Bacteroidia bacterium]|nr:MAG: hypothetical protein E4G95_09055 [Bacteroidia bacterium]